MHFPPPDIFVHILKFVDVMHHAPLAWNPFLGHDSLLDENPTLAALARTCRAFSEPTLDLLWSSQVTLAPLIWTLGDKVRAQYQEPQEMSEKRGKNRTQGFFMVRMTHLLLLTKCIEVSQEYKTYTDCLGVVQIPHVRIPSEETWVLPHRTSQ